MRFENEKSEKVLIGRDAPTFDASSCGIKEGYLIPKEAVGCSSSIIECQALIAAMKRDVILGQYLMLKGHPWKGHVRLHVVLRM